VIVSASSHRLDFDLAETDRVRRRRTRHSGKKYARQNVCMRETAAHRPHRDRDKMKKPLSDAAGIHQTPGKKEKRDRQKQEIAHFIERRAGDHRGDARIESVAEQPCRRSEG
jgi:hypothetical protein